MILTVASNKGGVGKSTTAFHLAQKLSESYRVLLIDADEEPTNIVWAEARAEREPKHSATVVRLLGRSVKSEGQRLAENYDFTIIDVGGSDNVALRSALMVSDKMLMPISVSNADSINITRMLSIIEDAWGFNEKLEVMTLINRVDTRARDSEEMREHLKEAYGIDAMKTVVHERKVFRQAPLGIAVFEAEGHGESAFKAKKEIEKLVEEILS